MGIRLTSGWIGLERGNILHQIIKRSDKHQPDEVAERDVLDAPWVILVFE